ncbi:hypothetical protein BX600DRAFT_516215 [Xylariales sp. PMI_506]|nr:hypothetical protein BX600DRAFT_516215 [Xylariales sp. PMI_506]
MASRPSTKVHYSSSSSSSSSDISYGGYGMDTISTPIASVEVLRCLRCARSVETTTTDDPSSQGMVRIGHNIYYCTRSTPIGCATPGSAVSLPEGFENPNAEEGTAMTTPNSAGLRYQAIPRIAYSD